MKVGWAVLVACGSALAEEPKFSGGDGSSCEQAIVPIVSEGGTMVNAERLLQPMALGESPDGKRRFDLVLWRKPDGQTVDICFDVTTVFEDTIREIEREEEHGYPHSPPR